MSYNNYGNNGYNKSGYNGGYQQNGGGYNKSNTGATQNNTGNNQSGKVGAIWRGQTRTGEEFLSIMIGDKKYVAFLNRFKQSPNQPDFNIMESKQQSNTGATTQAGGYQAKTNGRYTQASGYNKGYQKQTQVQEQNMDAYYAAQAGVNSNNQNIETVADIPSLPGNDDGIVVF